MVVKGERAVLAVILLVYLCLIGMYVYVVQYDLRRRDCFFKQTNFIINGKNLKSLSNSTKNFKTNELRANAPSMSGSIINLETVAENKQQKKWDSRLEELFNNKAP